MDKGAGNAADSAAGILHLSTETVAPVHRVSLMGDLMARTLAGGEIAVEDGAALACDWTMAPLGPGVVLCNAVQRGFVAKRTPKMLRDDDADFSIFLCRRGSAPFEQNGRREILRPGEMLLVAHGRPVESRWESCDVTILRVPREALPKTLSIEAAGGVLLGRESAASRLLRGYIAALAPLVRRGETPAIAARHLSELAALALTEGLRGPGGAGGDGTAGRAARRALLHEEIGRRYADPGFNMGAAAAAIGLSERSGYVLFEEAGESFSDTLYAMRLDRAAEMLRAGYRGRMLDLALDVGFSDVSHFNRRFRQRFGRSPREMRAAAGFS